MDTYKVKLHCEAGHSWWGKMVWLHHHTKRSGYWTIRDAGCGRCRYELADTHYDLPEILAIKMGQGKK